MECWQLDGTVDALVAEDVLEAWDEVAEVLVESALHAARHVGHDAARYLHAVLLLRLERILDKASYFVDLNLLSEPRHAHAKALKGNQTILGHAVCLLEDANYQLDYVVADACVHSVANFHELHL